MKVSCSVLGEEAYVVIFLSPFVLLRKYLLPEEFLFEEKRFLQLKLDALVYNEKPLRNKFGSGGLRYI